MRYSIWEDQRMVAFFAEQFALHPEGVVPIHWAARLCAVHRETLLHAVATGRMRSATYGKHPVIRVIPFVDVCQYQAWRAGTLRRRDWAQLTRDALRNEQRNLERVGDTIVCTCCGWADAIENVKKREPETRLPLGRWPHDLSTPDDAPALENDLAKQQSER